MDFILLVEQDGIVIKGENEVIQRLSPSHMFHKTCCTPSQEPTTSPRNKVRQRKPPSRLIETIERKHASTRKLKGLLIQKNSKIISHNAKRIVKSKC
jgi:hypothetical protein